MALPLVVGREREDEPGDVKAPDAVISHEASVPVASEKWAMPSMITPLPSAIRASGASA